MNDLISLRKWFTVSAAITVGISMVFAVIFSFVIAKKSYETQTKKIFEAAHRTLISLLVPALDIANYGEVERLLGIASQNDVTYAVITPEGDVLLSDYFQNKQIAEIYPKHLRNTTCRSLSGAVPPHLARGFFCSDITGDGTDSSRGVLVSLRNLDSFSVFWPNFALSVSVLIIFSILATLLIRQRVYQTVFRPLEQLVAALKAKRGSDSLEAFNVNLRLPQEINEIALETHELMRSQREFLKLHEEKSKMESLHEMATQVAHDIRAPLSALNIICAQSKGLPREHLNLIVKATNRINQISENLLRNHRDPRTGQCEAANAGRDLQNLSEIVAEIVEEQKIIIKDKTEIKVNLSISADAENLMVNVNASGFKQALSNLLSNSIEALGDCGSVKVRIQKFHDKAKISILDNGIGMPHDVLQKLGCKGFSFGKDRGNGLGFYFAKNEVEDIGGSINVESSAGSGTRVDLVVPSAELH